MESRSESATYGKRHKQKPPSDLPAYKQTIRNGKFSSSQILFVSKNVLFFQIFSTQQNSVESYVPDRHAYIQTNRQTYRWREIQTDKLTNGQIYRQTDRQTEIKIEILTDGKNFVTFSVLQPQFFLVPKYIFF